ncbi:hypothetical protein [Streptomyces sp. NPDC007905]|uniref:hypothetical protein n=1 Tax=Streptomyces sp. NPDC007905 TaxID=3364788 RepID=UPI0036E07B06
MTGTLTPKTTRFSIGEVHTAVFGPPPVTACGTFILPRHTLLAALTLLALILANCWGPHR